MDYMEHRRRFWAMKQMEHNEGNKRDADRAAIRPFDWPVFPRDDSARLAGAIPSQEMAGAEHCEYSVFSLWPDYSLNGPYFARDFASAILLTEDHAKTGRYVGGFIEATQGPRCPYVWEA